MSERPGHTLLDQSVPNPVGTSNYRAHLHWTYRPRWASATNRP